MKQLLFAYRAPSATCYPHRGPLEPPWKLPWTTFILHLTRYYCVCKYELYILYITCLYKLVSWPHEAIPPCSHRSHSILHVPSKVTLTLMLSSWSITSHKHSPSVLVMVIHSLPPTPVIFHADFVNNNVLLYNRGNKGSCQPDPKQTGHVFHPCS